MEQTLFPEQSFLDASYSEYCCRCHFKGVGCLDVENWLELLQSGHQYDQDGILLNYIP